jgi:hypothetical protein
VADTFDALTTNRPYQRAYEPPEALRIINNLVGKRLDPEAVAALTAVFNRGEIRVRRLVRAQATPPPEASATATPAAPAAVAPNVAPAHTNGSPEASGVPVGTAPASTGAVTEVAKASAAAASSVSTTPLDTAVDTRF